MTLQELVERLQSHPAYQSGRAADIEVHVNNGLWPLATRRVQEIDWATHEGKEYIVLDVTSQRAGPMTGQDLAKVLQGGEVGGGGHPV